MLRLTMQSFFKGLVDIFRFSTNAVFEKSIPDQTN